MKNKYALVLGGGGAKGSYQIGVWKALKSLNIKLDAVIGTSVGALNGAMIAMNDYQQALDIWQSMELKNIISIPESFVEENINLLKKDNITEIKNLYNSFISKGGADTTPLKNAINNFLSEEKIRKRNIDLGLVTYDISNFKPIELFLENIPNGKLATYLLGSATLPGFQITQISGKKLVDGGLYDNIPYNLTRKRGYKRIIVVDISGPGVNRKINYHGTDTIYIKNSSDTGSILGFTEKQLENNIQMGYNDTMKIFGQLHGEQFTVDLKRSNYQKLVKIYYSKKFQDKISLFINKLNIDYNNDILSLVPDEYRFRKDIVLALAECTANCLKINNNKAYHFDELLNIINDKKTNITNKKRDISIQSIIEMIKSYKSIFNIPALEYEQVLNSIIGKKSDETAVLKSKLFPEITTTKIFLKLIEELYFK